MGLTSVFGLLAISTLVASAGQPPATTQSSSATATFAYISDGGAFKIKLSCSLP